MAQTDKSETLLMRGLSRLGFAGDVRDNLAQKIEAYIKEIQLFNSAYNLVNSDEHDALVVRHIFDSLAPHREIARLAETIMSSKFCAKPARVDKSKFRAKPANPTDDATRTTRAARVSIGDIGSGAGLPGVPLALAFPQFSFTLVERMEKRCAFLENVAAVLRLQNVRVLKSEARLVPPKTFDISVFRAFRPLDTQIAKTLLSLITRGGFLAAYKAKRTNIEAEMRGVHQIIKKYEIVNLRVPFMEDAERNLVVVQNGDWAVNGANAALTKIPAFIKY